MLLSDKKISALKKQYETKGYIVARNIFDRSDIIKAGHDLELSFLKSLNKLNGRNVNKTKNNVINSVHFMNNWKWSKRLKENKILRFQKTRTIETCCIFFINSFQNTSLM